MRGIVRTGIAAGRARRRRSSPGRAQAIAAGAAGIAEATFFTVWRQGCRIRASRGIEACDVLHAARKSSTFPA